MNSQIAFAYGIAGLSAAIAAAVIIGSTIGFHEEGPVPVEIPATECPAPEAALSAPVAPVAPDAPAASVAPELVEEVVYVDERGRPVSAPAARSSRGGWEEDERWEHEEGEDGERWEHEEEEEEHERREYSERERWEDEDDDEHYRRGGRRERDDD